VLILDQLIKLDPVQCKLDQVDQLWTLPLVRKRLAHLNHAMPHDAYLSCTCQAADHVGLAAVRLLRRGFDMATGYGADMTEAKWLQRMIFLETVAGVPGMVAGMLRHLHSLRLMRRDQGW
jgi:hypothetical protein